MSSLKLQTAGTLNGNLSRIKEFGQLVIREPDTEYFKPTGVYCISNCGGFEVELSPDGYMARMKDAFGSEIPEISDWKTIEYIIDPEDPDSEETIPVIDPEGYNIPVHLVMRS